MLLPSIILVLTSLTSAGPSRRRDVLDNTLEGIDDSISRLVRLQESVQGLPDNSTGERVAQWHQGMSVNPEELGSYVEGDILFPPGVGRNGLRAESTLWPGGVVPYVISPYFDARQRKLIYEAMNDYHKYTCVRFKPYRGVESDYIRITAGNSGCWSSVGRTGGWQNVNLQVPGCLSRKGTVIHELMHAIGFLHEQSRYERDDYVSIRWNNIMRGHARNFEKASRETTNAFGVEYDYDSVMHYSSYAFSKNGQPTIVPKTFENEVGFSEGIYEYFQGDIRPKLGQREGFSKKDILKIRRMYRCF